MKNPIKKVLKHASSGAGKLARQITKRPISGAKKLMKYKSK